MISTKYEFHGLLDTSRTILERDSEHSDDCFITNPPASKLTMHTQKKDFDQESDRFSNFRTQANKVGLKNKLKLIELGKNS